MRRLRYNTCPAILMEGQGKLWRYDLEFGGAECFDRRVTRYFESPCFKESC